MDVFQVFVAFVCFFILVLFGILIVDTLSDFGEGEVTDKYILPHFSGRPTYYLVLNDEKDIVVDEETYYKYDIGDEYP